MNPVALYFASGDSLYFGCFLLSLAIVASPVLKHHWWLLLRNIASWIGLAFVIMASPPVFWGVDALLFATFSLWFIASNIAKPSKAVVWLRLSVAIVLFVSVLVLTASEFSHRKMPLITGASSDHLTVIGDSISSGIDPRSPNWPNVFQQLTGVPVKNLSKPGAGVIEARAMAESIASEDRVVIVEIGGNDLLSGTTSVEFERNLDSLLSKLAAPGRVVVMFELPLLPNRIEYGRIQRRLASHYGVRLIPKRYFAEIISGRNSTSDGLHLSQKGGRQMALLVANVFSSVLKSPSGLPNSQRGL
jgi:acyl-CoA thioesterase-1